MIEVREMRYEDLDEVMKIENVCFAIPWTRESMQGELFSLMKFYYVALFDGKIAGYGGMWHVVTEGHITNIAVSPDYRRMGVGSAIVDALMNTAEEKEMLGVTLEVRVSNEAAIKLYKKHGFVVTGTRKKYYSDNNEDAYLMWNYLIPIEDIIEAN
ncbi:MAG: ribosomal protein S18-alanine N-acetyltransferase [Firmicutes bacterium]|nr:ribosomal protein S18-alanine N-acetyltransferase [Bacillota bacterium]